MARPKLKDKENKEESSIPDISNISSHFDRYKDKHWEVSQKIICMEAKLKALKDERKEVERAMKEAAAVDKSLWNQLEIAF